VTLIIKIFDFFSKLNPIKKKAALFVLFLCVVGCLNIIFGNLVFSIFLSICLSFTLSEILRTINDKRLEVLNSQLIDFAVNMIVMVKAGKSLRNIIKLSMEWAKLPLSQYLKRLSDELEMNSSFDDALDNFVKNCASREAQLISTALKLNNRIGGNLVLVLSNIAETLQENFKARANARTMTLQSRYSGNIVAMVPVLVLLILFFTMNSSINNFFSSRVGNVFLLAGCSLEIAGILIIRKILEFKNL